jgi:hypothetical protein
MLSTALCGTAAAAVLVSSEDDPQTGFRPPPAHPAGKSTAIGSTALADAGRLLLIPQPNDDDVVTGCSKLLALDRAGLLGGGEKRSASSFSRAEISSSSM